MPGGRAAEYPTIVTEAVEAAGPLPSLLLVSPTTPAAGHTRYAEFEDDAGAMRVERTLLQRPRQGRRQHNEQRQKDTRASEPPLLQWGASARSHGRSFLPLALHRAPAALFTDEDNNDRYRCSRVVEARLEVEFVGSGARDRSRDPRRTAHTQSPSAGYCLPSESTGDSPPLRLAITPS